MRLLELLTSLDDDALAELQAEFSSGDMTESRGEVCLALERELMSPSQIRVTVNNVLPPGFSMLCRLLDAPGHALPFAGIRDCVSEEAASLAARVTGGDLARTDFPHVVYRAVFLEALRSDMELDPSETALLGHLRHALGIRAVEHFLLEHHQDFQPFWHTDHAFLDVMRRLRGRGLVYLFEGQLRLPTDLVQGVRQVLGLQGSSASRRRLLERLSNDDLRTALDAAGLKLSGAKEDRLQRLLDNYVQPRDALQVLGLGALRELCRDCRLQVSGSKDDLEERIALHFATDGDIRPETPLPPPPPPEERMLAPSAFDALFGSLRGEDLTDILMGIGSSRVTGSKEAKVALLRETRLSEESLLLQLDLTQLEAILARRRLKIAGSKRERVARLLEDASVPHRIETAPDTPETS